MEIHLHIHFYTYFLDKVTDVMLFVQSFINIQFNIAKISFNQGYLIYEYIW